MCTPIYGHDAAAILPFTVYSHPEMTQPPLVIRWTKDSLDTTRNNTKGERKSPKAKPPETSIMLGAAAAISKSRWGLEELTPGQQKLVRWLERLGVKDDKIVELINLEGINLTLLFDDKGKLRWGLRIVKRDAEVSYVLDRKGTVYCIVPNSGGTPAAISYLITNFSQRKAIRAAPVVPEPANPAPSRPPESGWCARCYCVLFGGPLGNEGEDD